MRKVLTILGPSRHNPFAMFEGVAGNATRAKRIRNFNDFAAVSTANLETVLRLTSRLKDVSADALPSWIFIGMSLATL